jgi:arabinose-5-phosphate isomerase
LVRVKDLMRTDNLPFINEDASFTELLLCMSEGRLGMVIIGDSQNVKGIITDGDLRRALVRTPDTTQLSASNMMTITPVFVDPEQFINQAETLMIEKRITTVLVGSATDRNIAGVYQIYNG